MRVRYGKMRCGFVALQSRLRGQIARLDADLRRAAIVAVQSIVRMVQQRRKFSIVLFSIVVMQSTVRAWRAYKSFQNAKLSSLLIQVERCSAFIDFRTLVVHCCYFFIAAMATPSFATPIQDYASKRNPAAGCSSLSSGLDELPDQQAGMSAPTAQRAPLRSGTRAVQTAGRVSFALSRPAGQVGRTTDLALRRRRRNTSGSCWWEGAQKRPAASRGDAAQ
jgi:hypothetical protein